MKDLKDFKRDKEEISIEPFSKGKIKG